MSIDKYHLEVLMTLVYTNSRNYTSEYDTSFLIAHPLNFHTPNDNTRDRPPSLAGRVIPRPQGSTFWGRISAFDHLAVKRMLKKEPNLINSNWEDLTPITCLLNGFTRDKTIQEHYEESYYTKHASRLLKMLRILCDFGSIINSQHILPYIERYPFHDEHTAHRVFNMLLHRGLYLDDYKILDEKEIMLLEEKKALRGETYLYWGRKVIHDHIQYRTRLFCHVYLRDIVPTKPQLCYDVIGHITSFL